MSIFEHIDEDFEGRVTEGGTIVNFDRIKQDQVFPDLQWGFCEKKPLIQRYFIIEKDTIVETAEGDMLGHPGDVLMEDTDGNFYICRGKLFKKTYQLMIAEDWEKQQHE